MKKFTQFVLIAALLSAFASAGTVTGVQQNAASGPVTSGTYTFTLTQGATVAGTANVAATSVFCYTDSVNGNVVGQPDPPVPPTLTTQIGVGTLPAGTYFVKVTFKDASGETVGSAEATINLAGQGTLNVSIPTNNQPPQATGFVSYITSTSGSYATAKQGTITGTPGSWAQFSQSVPLVVGTAIPSSNTTACKLRFNDELTPSFTGYNVGLVDSSGNVVSGFPQLWYLAGGSSGTVNISNGTPLYSGSYAVQFPQAVVQQPPLNAAQSISGPLDLGVFGLTLGGSICLNSDSGITRAAAAVFNIGTCTPGDASGTLRLDVLQQGVSNVGFGISDFNGVAHFFISGTAPYTNTFLGGGSGQTFVGTHFNVAEGTGAVSTDGSYFAFSSTHTLPAQCGNDNSGGFGCSTNAGQVYLMTNAGFFSINSPTLGTGAALTVGGTSATTGGLSIFVGGPGAANEMLAVKPSDGATAATRMQAISVRALSGGFLTGAQSFGVTNAGLVSGANLTGTTTGNTVQVLNAQGAVGPQTGNSSDQVVYTYTLPANVIDTNAKALEIQCGLVHSSGTANPSVKLNLNGVNVSQGNIGTTASQSVTFISTVVRTSSTTAGAIGFTTATGAFLPFSIALTGLNWAAPQTVTCTENVANTDQITGVAFLVKQIQ